MISVEALQLVFAQHRRIKPHETLEEKFPFEKKIKPKKLLVSSSLINC